MNIYFKKQDLANYDCLSEKSLERLGLTADIISLDDIFNLLEELYFEKEHLEEELDDLKENVRENYKPISPYEMYGVSERDFH